MASVENHPILIAPEGDFPGRAVGGCGVWLGDCATGAPAPADGSHARVPLRFRGTAKVETGNGGARDGRSEKKKERDRESSTERERERQRVLGGKRPRVVDCPAPEARWERTQMPLKRSSSDPDILMSARGVNKVRAGTTIISYSSLLIWCRCTVVLLCLCVRARVCVCVCVCVCVRTQYRCRTTRRRTWRNSLARVRIAARVQYRLVGWTT